METGISVGDLMTRNFIWVSPDTNLKICAKTMIKKRVGSLVIKEGDKLKGILTEKDIVWTIVKQSKKDLGSILARDLMKRKVVTIKPNKDLAEALRVMKKKKIRRLPVVENGKVIGMITTKDIFKVDPGLFEVLAESGKVREEAEKMKRMGVMSAPRKQGSCEECGEIGLLYGEDGEWFCEKCYDKK